MKKSYLTLISAVALSSLSGPALANDLRTALTDGDVDLSLRYRLEHVDQEDVDKEALASTLKTRLTYTSKAIHDTVLTLEFDDVHVIGEEKYNIPGGSTSNADRPVVADPEGTELNQASLTYTGLTDSTIVLGKQRIVLGNQRWVGGVAWRQHEQTYNAGTFVNTSLPETKIIYSYVDKVNSFIHTADDINTETNVLYIENESIANHKISVYAFLLNHQDLSTASNQTIGARFEGGFGGLGYTLEYAEQSDYNRPSGSADFDADYELVEVSYAIDGIKLLAGLEVLGSDDGKAGLQTQLATKHKFNGWADQFLNTPNEGLEDTYIGAIGKLSDVTVKVFYHEYEANEGRTNYKDYGDEINLAIAKKFGGVNALLKFADYSADDHGKDIQKVWLQLATKF